MFSEKDLLAAGKHFAIVGPRVSRAEIETIFSGSFYGKEEVVQFYSRFNGGGRTEKSCVMHCGNPAHQVSCDALDKMQIEGFRSVSTDPKDRMLPFAPIIGHHATMLRTYEGIPKMKAFLTESVPFAFDHRGNDLCLDLGGGRILFMNWDEYRKGPVQVATSFRDLIFKFWIGAKPRFTIDF